jgi:hypothetical protein
MVSSATPGRSTGITLKSRRLTRRSRAARISSFCQDPKPEGPTRTAHAELQASAASSPSCHGSPFIRCHLSRNGLRLARSRSLRAICSTTSLSELLWLKNTSQWTSTVYSAEQLIRQQVNSSLEASQGQRQDQNRCERRVGLCLPLVQHAVPAAGNAPHHTLSTSPVRGSPDLLDLEFENTVPVVVVPKPLLYRLSRICTKTVQRERQCKSIREREVLDAREEILTPDPLLQ